MKNILIKILTCLLIVSCSKNEANSNCGYLVNAGVDFTINLNLPQFNDLQNSGNSVYISNQGNGGLIVTQSGIGLFAWDAADPNHSFSDCSIMTIIGGINAKCNCDDKNEYSLITGQSLSDSTLPCRLKQYRIEEISSNIFYISN